MNIAVLPPCHRPPILRPSPNDRDIAKASLKSPRRPRAQIHRTLAGMPSLDVGCNRPMVMIISHFNGTSTPKGSYHVKTGDNDCNVNSSRYSLRTTLCETICYQGKSEQNVRQDLIPRLRHGEAALMHPPPPDSLGTCSRCLICISDIGNAKIF